MTAEPSCILAIDAGNTRTKWGVYDAAGKALSQGVGLNSELALMITATNLPHASLCRRTMISNVAGADVQQALVAALSDVGLPAIFVTSSGKACQVSNDYHQPHTLGTDRWCSLMAAWNRYHQPSLVVSAGTALTVDALALDPATQQGCFMGGMIVPGLRLMQASLVKGTAGLGTAVGTWQDFPRTTADAIHTGAVTAMTGVVLGMLARHGANKCVLTGGDAALLAQALRTVSSCQLEIVDDLVLQGLCYINKEMNEGEGQ